MRVPCVGTMDLLRRHPFLYKGDWSTRPPSLEIAFTAEGVPIAVYPGSQPAAAPVLVSCKPMPTVQQNCTVNRVKNSSQDAALTVSGIKYVNNMLFIPGVTAAPAPPPTPRAAPARPAASKHSRKRRK